MTGIMRELPGVACVASDATWLLLLCVQVLWDSVVVEAYGNEKGLLGGVKVQNVKTQQVTDLPLAGVFFAIGHEPATKFLDGQLTLDAAGYVVTAPDSTATNVPGVFAAGDVQDAKYRQAITAAGSGEQQPEVCVGMVGSPSYSQHLGVQAASYAAAQLPEGITAVTIW